MCALGSWTVRLSRFGPPAFLIARDDVAGRDRAEQLAGVGRRPSPPARRCPSASSAALISLACSRPRTVLISRARRMSSACRCGAAGGDDRQSARQQVVAAVAVLDLDGVAGGPPGGPPRR